MIGLTVREVPAPDPLHGGLADPSHPDVPGEPVVNIDNIQGNILPGFTKDHQTLLFFRITDPPRFKRWLREQIPSIATLAEVLSFNRLFKEMRVRLGKDPTGAPTNLKVTWTNVAFTARGLARLGIDVDEFTEQAFKEGLAARSGRLGDPPGNAEGNPERWLVLDGEDDGTSRVSHVIFIVAGDDPRDVKDRVRDIRRSIRGATPVGFLNTNHPGQEDGENLPGALAGHEHFGFLDGVSQPGVRGRLSDDPRDVLTVRQNPNNREQGKPGQELIWPGEFVFGYPGQDGNADDDPRKPFKQAGPLTTADPEWANDGSFLVFRRLRQDVNKFHAFVKDTADRLQANVAPSDVSPDLIGSRFVGRWPSGAPILRTRDDETNANDTDNPALADDDCANNNFEFHESTEPLPPTAFDDPFACTDENPNPPPPQFQAARRDQEGAVCPFTGHIRKAYPRDDRVLDPQEPTQPPNPPNPVFPFTKHAISPDGLVSNDEGDPIVLNEDDTQNHRILRRGIPFGPPLQGSTVDDPKPDDGIDRGLHFIAYMTSIEDQFEFIIRNWVNNPDFKEPRGPAPTHPPTQLDANTQGGGHDPIIGQNNATPDRIREFTVAFKDEAGKRVIARVSTDDGAGKGLEWVIPTGGGYYFAPSIKALQNRLAMRKPQPPSTGDPVARQLSQASRRSLRR
jgi:deferrochelatase/peroxidase EfeB